MADLTSEFMPVLLASPLTGLLITLVTFYGGQKLYERSGRSPWCQPVVIGISLTIILLLVLGLPYADYYRSAAPLHLLLGPTTVALAVPLFQQAGQIRRLLLPIICTVITGGTLTVALAAGIVYALGGSADTLSSMYTKSITTPIAMVVTESLGGVPALSALYVLVTGALGAMIGIPLMQRLNIRDERVKGVTLGLCAHALGTARALEESRECAAFSALAMGLTGILTALILPWLLS